VPSPVRVADVNACQELGRAHVEPGPVDVDHTGGSGRESPIPGRGGRTGSQGPFQSSQSGEASETECLEAESETGFSGGSDRRPTRVPLPTSRPGRCRRHERVLPRVLAPIDDRSPGENFTEPGLMSVWVSLIGVENFRTDRVN